MSTTAMQLLIGAPPAQVYRALVDPTAVASWMVPDGMRSEVHTFDAREGGAFRISLTYDNADGHGKSSAHTDTYHGRFVRLVPDSEVVQTMEFETDDPAMQGAMTVRFTLTERDGGTMLHAEHANVPRGVAPADNETGWRMSLGKLKQLVETAA